MTERHSIYLFKLPLLEAEDSSNTLLVPSIGVISLLGIASSLLQQLHYHLHECHGAGSVGLHVLISNMAAVRLYCTEGYGVWSRTSCLCTTATESELRFFLALPASHPRRAMNSPPLR